jgi:hypothetical protein
VISVSLPKERFDQELEKLFDVAVELGADDILPVEDEEGDRESVEPTDEVAKREVEVRWILSEATRY